MNKKVKSGLRSAARKLWMYYDENRKAKILQSKIGRGQYKCELCFNVYSKIEIDHITPAGSFNTFLEFGEWLNRLFCPTTNLRAICKNCHLKHGKRK